MAWQLSPSIAHHRFAGCAIVLDLARDRYWRVDSDLAFALEWVAGRAAGPVYADTFARLQRLALIVTGGTASRSPTARTALPARCSVLEQHDREPALAPLDLIEVAALLWAARRELRATPLCQIVDGHAARTAGHRLPRGDVKRLARRFEVARRFLPFPPRCLPDSVALLRFVARRGHRPTLVFGVEANPFAAHCWVQSGTCVLNDAVGHARGFAPLLAV